MNASTADLARVEQRLHCSIADISAVCRRYGVTRLSIFGSIMRDDFGPASDVDFLYEVPTGSDFPFSGLADMQADLETLVGRKVDLVSKGVFANPYRAATIRRDLRRLPVGENDAPG